MLAVVLTVEVGMGSAEVHLPPGAMACDITHTSQESKDTHTGNLPQTDFHLTLQLYT